MQFPYTEVASGLFRPLVPILIWGPAGCYLADGLLDTGADRTLLGPRLAQAVGIVLDSLATVATVQSASVHVLTCKVTTVTFQMRRDSQRLSWLAEVAVPIQSVKRSIWGFKGFLEYFRARFDGPNRRVTLTAGANLPKATPRP
jgi:hypothetical protein